MKWLTMSGKDAIGRLRVVLGHIGHGYSLIIAPHDTGTPVTFNVPGRVAVMIVVLAVAVILGLAFVGVTYTKLAFLAFETGRLRAENSKLRVQAKKIGEIEGELRRIENLRQRIEAWAGVLPRDSVAVSAEDMGLMPRTWPRRYCYALLEPYYRLSGSGVYGMVQPAVGWVSRRFSQGSLEDPGHRGIDIAAATGTTVRSAMDGVVRSAGWDDIYGNVVRIDHNDSLSTVYGHNDTILVKEGEYVTKGQAIATVGNTGRSTAPHLHFEILKNGKPCDPEDFIAFKSQ
jgi:murein DD-endopeptidase MepM/ murein hydrolase activator NlpD